MTDSTIHPPTQLVARLDMIEKGAAVAMTAFLIVGITIAITRGNSPTALNIGLHLITMGIVMTIAVGAVADHKMILQQQERIQNEQAETSQRLDRLVAALADEVGDQRASHHR